VVGLCATWVVWNGKLRGRLGLTSLEGLGVDDVADQQAFGNDTRGGIVWFIGIGVEQWS
jgi:hypothetical protein